MWFYSHFIPMLSSAGALYAAYWRIKAAKEIRNWAPLHMAIAAMSVFYFFAWSLLWSGFQGDRAVWSEYVGTVSAVSFFVVWALPARKAVKDRESKNSEGIGG